MPKCKEIFSFQKYFQICTSWIPCRDSGQCDHSWRSRWWTRWKHTPWTPTASIACAYFLLSAACGPSSVAKRPSIALADSKSTRLLSLTKLTVRRAQSKGSATTTTQDVTAKYTQELNLVLNTFDVWKVSEKCLLFQ